MSTIQIPSRLSEQVEERGIPQVALETAVAVFVEAFLEDEQLHSAELEWSDARAFADRLIRENRTLFERLAKL